MDKYYIVKKVYSTNGRVAITTSEIESDTKPFISRIDADNPHIIEFCFDTQAEMDWFVGL